MELEEMRTRKPVEILEVDEDDEEMTEEEESEETGMIVQDRETEVAERGKHERRSAAMPTGLEMVRSLAPRVGEMMAGMLDDKHVPAVAKVRIMEVILEYTYGRPESTIKVMNAQQSVEASEMRIAAIVETVRKDCGM